MNRDQLDEEIYKNRALILQDFVNQALKYYNEINKTLPAIIAIYRDGVGGQSKQEKVIRYEVEAV